MSADPRSPGARMVLLRLVAFGRAAALMALTDIQER